MPHEIETIIVGTGFAGLMAAIGLKRKGFCDFVMLERNAEMGGTWQVNSYPGAEVDIPTSLYCLSSVAFPFRKTFSPQSELLEYTNHIIEKFGLREKTRTNQAVIRASYEASTCRWTVQVASGEQYICRFLIDTSGVLANPHTPDIPGATTFDGPSFHAGQWDHNVEYAGKRVGVIGSGCSGAQVVPGIADKVSRLTLFMGKAQWILPRTDRSFGKLERYLRTLPGIRHGIRLMVFMLYDIRFLGFRRYPVVSGLARPLKGYYRWTLKRQLARYVTDDRLRQHMMPDYELGSRRVIPTNTYLPALARDNVDVEIDGIECMTPEGIRTTDGRDIPLDIIVYATGYYAYSDMKRAITFQVEGLDGRNLNREWEQAICSYKGIMVVGYPNYFKVNGPNTGSGHSSQISYMEAATAYMLKAISAVKKDDRIRAIEPRQDRQDAYVARLKQQMQKTVWQNANCTAFYRKDMTGDVTSLSPESATGFILSRKCFRLNDYRLIT